MGIHLKSARLDLTTGIKRQAKDSKGTFNRNLSDKKGQRLQDKQHFTHSIL